MTQPWKMIKPDDIDIVAPDGTVRSRVKGYYSGKQFIIDDMSVDVRVDDEIRRLLPNGREEAFRVTDPKFYDGPFGKHYQVSISRPQNFAPHQGGNYSINVAGANSRVNIGSSDSSINVANENVVENIRQALGTAVEDAQHREELERLLSHIATAKDKGSFTAAYQQFITSAANHMTILAPFLPALTNILTHLPS